VRSKLDYLVTIAQWVPSALARDARQVATLAFLKMQPGNYSTMLAENSLEGTQNTTRVGFILMSASGVRLGWVALRAGWRDPNRRLWQGGDPVRAGCEPLLQHGYICNQGEAELTPPPLDYQLVKAGEY